MAEGDAQARVVLHQVTRDDRGRRQPDIGRVAQRLLQLSWPHQPLHARWPDGMYEYRGTECLGLGKERQELRRPDRSAVDVAANLDAGETEFAAYPMQLGDGTIHILQRHRTQSSKSPVRLAHHLRDLVVDEP